MTSGPVYLDASAILKLIVPEPGTIEVIDYLRERPIRVTCGISPIEVRRAATRRVGGAVRTESIFAGIEVLDLTPTIVERAATLPPDTLRSLDAIHLATALELGAELAAFVVYDRRLATAARAAGLSVASPGVAA